jgi:hypothetical protein
LLRRTAHVNVIHTCGLQASGRMRRTLAGGRW